VVLIRINSKIEDELTKGPSNRCTDGHETIALIYTYYTKSNNELEYRVIDINGDSLSLERVRLPHLLEATNSGTIGLLLTYERNYGWGSMIADTLLQDKLNVKRLKIMVNSIHETYFSGIGLAQRKVNYHNIESNHVLTSYYIN
jgi:hypothetical protein